jgi:membrane-associated phospholipid phosphatase
LIGSRPPLAGREIDDYVLNGTECANQWLHAHPNAANALLIASSATIDVMTMFLLIWSIAGPSIRPFLGLLLVFGMRQISQGLCALPAPPGMIWHDPGFPSVVVTYAVANDFFFSGHTALAVYGAIELARLGRRPLVAAAAVLAVLLAGTVIVLRAHWTMDVVAGALAALYASVLARQWAPAWDRAIARLRPQSP